jgi:hypothetical protein
MKRSKGIVVISINTILLALSFIYLFKINRDNYFIKQNMQPCTQIIKKDANENDIDFAYFDDPDYVCLLARKTATYKYPKQDKSASYSLPKTSEDIHLQKKALDPLPTYTSYFQK